MTNQDTRMRRAGTARPLDRAILRRYCKAGLHRVSDIDRGYASDGRYSRGCPECLKLEDEAIRESYRRRNRAILGTEREPGIKTLHPLDQVPKAHRQKCQVCTVHTRLSTYRNKRVCKYCIAEDKEKVRSEASTNSERTSKAAGGTSAHE